MARYLVYVGSADTLDTIARELAGGGPSDHPAWTSIGSATFHVGRIEERGARIVAEEYGVRPSARIAFEVDPDRMREGRVAMFSAIAHLATRIDGDLVVVTSDDRPMLWRQGGRAIVNMDVLTAPDAERLGPHWVMGTGADLPRSMPFSEPEPPRRAP